MVISLEGLDSAFMIPRNGMDWWVVSVVWHGKRMKELQEDPYVMILCTAVVLVYVGVALPRWWFFSPKAWINYASGTHVEILLKHLLFHGKHVVNIVKWLTKCTSRLKTGGFQSRSGHQCVKTIPQLIIAWYQCVQFIFRIDAAGGSMVLSVIVAGMDGVLISSIIHAGCWWCQLLPIGLQFVFRIGAADRLMAIPSIVPEWMVL